MASKNGRVSSIPAAASSASATEFGSGSSTHLKSPKDFRVEGVRSLIVGRFGSSRWRSTYFLQGLLCKVASYEVGKESSSIGSPHVLNVWPDV